MLPLVPGINFRLLYVNHALYLSISDSPSLMSGTSSIGSVDSPLSSFITPSHFHSRLNTSLF